MPRKPCQQYVVRPAQYDPTTKENPLNNLDFHAKKPCLENRALSPCCTDCTDPYSTTQQQQMRTTLTQKFPLGFVPTLSWEMCPPSCSLSSLKLSQKISLNLLHLCLAHYPMHSFINLKMTFSLQSVFSPSQP
jgi:hypothetical protein